MARTIVRVALLVGTVVSLFFVPWSVLWAWALPLPGTVQAQAEQALGHGFEGIIVYVDPGGEPAQFYAAGWHDRDQMTPANPKALFKIASIAKLYDAVAIAKLVHDEKLALDGTLVEYFPELEGRIQYADQITLEMMVRHRSGIPNVTDTPDYWINPPENRKAALQRVLDRPAEFRPDQEYDYSNTNYLLIRELIERVSGKDQSEFVRDEVLKPLGLDQTYFSLEDIDIDDLMGGYYVGVEENIKTTDYGSMIASAENVGIFLRALNDGSLFEAGEQAIYSSIYRYGHTGLIPGYQSIARYHPDLDTVVVQFTNTTDFEGYHWNLSEVVYGRILKILRKTNGP